MSFWIEWLSGFLWGPGMLAIFIGTGLYFTVRTRFFQVRNLGRSIKLALGGLFERSENGGISPFRAVATALAGTMGVGNIAGVATAIVAGGAGSVFWMWVSAFFGMMTKYAEVALAVKYRSYDADGANCGGPMHYIERGLGMPRLAGLFAALCVLASFGVGNMTQVNDVAGVFGAEFGVPVWLTGVIVCGITFFVIFGGIRSISGISAAVIPSISAVYILLCCAALAVNISSLPGAISLIFTDAFGWRAAGGGVLGFAVSRAVRFGLSRGVFTNEAGLGSSTIAHAASSERDPVRQGTLGIFEVFLDTFVVTTLTALVILTVDGGAALSRGLNGSALTAAVFSSAFGRFGGIFIAVSIFCFALPSVFGWAYYGEQCVAWLFPGRSLAVTVYRVVFALTTLLGSTMQLSLAWSIADLFNGLMAVPNLTALLFLSREVLEMTVKSESDKTKTRER